MRRSQCEIKEKDKIEEILNRCRIGRLATTGTDGYPYVTPLNYVYWNGAIYFHCAKKGEKLDNIAADSRVCFEVDVPLAYKGTDCDPEASVCNVHQFYHAVIIRGRAEIVEDVAEKITALNALMAVHEGVPGFDRITAANQDVAACHVVVIHIERMSGKSDLAQKKSGEDKERIRHYLEKRGLAGDVEAAGLIR